MTNAAWLIETGSHVYWNGRKADRTAFTNDPNDAVRFSRRDDAERIIHWLLEEFQVFLVAREHSWLEPPAPAPQERKQGE